MYLHCGSSECWFVTQVNSLLSLIKWNIKVKILVFFMWKFWVELSNSQWKKVSKYFANNFLVNIAESLGVMATHGCVLKHIIIIIIVELLVPFALYLTELMIFIFQTQTCEKMHWYKRTSQFCWLTFFWLWHFGY